MTIIEDRLQELRDTVKAPGLPPAEEVKARGARRRRRTRRRRLAAVGAGAVALVLAPAVVVAVRHDRSPSTTIGDASDDGLPPGTTLLRVHGIPAEMIAINPYTGSILVSDLDTGLRTTYADGEHVLDFKTPEDFQADATATTIEGGGRTTYASGLVRAAMTRDGTLVAGVMYRPLTVLAPGQSLADPGRVIPNTDRWVQFLPTESGAGLWVYTNNQELLLIDLATGDVLQSLHPGGVGLVTTVGDQLVAYDGYNEGGRVRVISPEGGSEVISAPGEHGTFLAATSDRTVWLVDRDPSRRAVQGIGDTVTILGNDGTITDIPLPAGERGRWAYTGDQTGIESTRTLTRDDTRLLIELTDATDPTSTDLTRVVMIDLETGTADIVSPGGGAFWARDDRTAIVGGGGGYTALDTLTGTTTPVAGAILDDFMVIAGG